MGVGGYAYMCTGTLGGQKLGLDSLEMELESEYRSFKGNYAEIQGRKKEA